MKSKRINGILCTCTCTYSARSSTAVEHTAVQCICASSVADHTLSRFMSGCGYTRLTATSCLSLSQVVTPQVTLWLHVYAGHLVGLEKDTSLLCCSCISCGNSTMSPLSKSSSIYRPYMYMYMYVYTDLLIPVHNT